MTKQEILTLFDYDKWANERVLEAVAALTEEQYAKNLGDSFGGVRGTMVHIYGANRVWLDRWKERPTASLPKVETIPTFALLTEHWKNFQTELDEFLAALPEEKIHAELKYKDIKGNEYAQPLYHQMQHRVNHSSYHRGQITMMLRLLGAKPVGTDLITYYRLKTKHA